MQLIQCLTLSSNPGSTSVSPSKKTVWAFLPRWVLNALRNAGPALVFGSLGFQLQLLGSIRWTTLGAVAALHWTVNSRMISKSRSLFAPFQMTETRSGLVVATMDHKQLHRSKLEFCFPFTSFMLVRTTMSYPLLSPPSELIPGNCLSGTPLDPRDRTSYVSPDGLMREPLLQPAAPGLALPSDGALLHWASTSLGCPADPPTERVRILPGGSSPEAGSPLKLCRTKTRQALSSRAVATYISFAGRRPLFKEALERRSIRTYPL
mmetsp:Transcript_14441/g.41083  ORF Transcript_14441/g.41083 Transcript_14441/m.41083 type:complete len:264 (+) Transcript_14441:579-1370(+)